MRKTDKIWRKGQVALLAIILGILGLTVGLSAASRSLSDLKQASYVDFGTKALAAAESGVEYAIANTTSFPASGCAPDPGVKINMDNPSDPFYQFKNDFNEIKYKVCADSSGYAEGKGIGKDDVFQADIGGKPIGTYRIFWNSAVNAVEIAVVKTDSVLRYAQNSVGNSISGTNFSAAQAVSYSAGNCPSGGYGNQITIAAGAGSVDLVRVKPISQNPASTDILICGDSTSIPPQYYDFMAQAVTKNGTTKAVQLRRPISGTMPAVFDNVLYSGGSIIKQ